MDPQTQLKPGSPDYAVKAWQKGFTAAQRGGQLEECPFFTMPGMTKATRYRARVQRQCWERGLRAGYEAQGDTNANDGSKSRRKVANR